jgi:hypothetical protein
MIQRRECVGLALEARESVRIVDELVWEDLQRNTASELVSVARYTRPIHRRGER